jgi:hypothetical protein
MNKYKVEVLTEILKNMQEDEYYRCKVKGEDTKAINLNEETVKMLIDYYSK